MENDGTIKSLATPLLFQPGTDWAYGVGYDWLGILIERISGMSLDDYLQKNVFGPLGIKDTTHRPQGDQVARMATCHYRHPQAGMVPILPNPIRWQFDKADAQCFGGTSLFGPPAQYVKLLVPLLNGGLDPVSKTRILKPESVQMLLEKSAPQFEKEKRGAHDTVAFVISEVDEMSMPGREESKKGWGMGGLVEEDGTVWWGGAGNQFWWIDRAKGVAGTFATSMLPFLGEAHCPEVMWILLIDRNLDPKAMDVWKQVLDVVN